MKRKRILVLGLVLLLAGCVRAVRLPFFMKDGLYLRYKLTSSDVPQYYTYTFRQVDDKKYQMTLESEQGRQTRYVQPDFSDFDQPLMGGVVSGPAGGNLWLPPHLLRADAVEGWSVAGETTKKGYSVYRVTAGGGNVGYYEKKTGFQIAFENAAVRPAVYVELVKTNAAGLEKKD
ncbi:MAG: hypothetical protein ACM3L6_00060 [Deltaproteobacteria bacterium]